MYEVGFVLQCSLIYVSSTLLGQQKIIRSTIILKVFYFVTIRRVIKNFLIKLILTINTFMYYVNNKIKNLVSL